LDKGFKLDSRLLPKRQNDKEIPFAYLAKPKDGHIISNLYYSIYKGKYPYREMQDSHEVSKLIKNKKYNWILYKNKNDEIVGCMGFFLELTKKKGYLFGFIINKKFFSTIDSLKAFLECIIVLWNYYKNKILIWYSETRTAHNITQYAQNLVGLKPIAFFPVKDLFFGKPESEFLHVIYDKELLKDYRTSETPRIIRQVLNSYLYAEKLYHLGKPVVENPKINFDSEKLHSLENNYLFRSESRYNTYEKIKLSFKNSDSFFQFLYNHQNNSAENSEYYVRNVEELQLLLKKLKEIINEKNIRYFQCFVSSYKPKHQKTFLINGFRPFGYVPSWNYNKKANLFEDSIVFIHLKEKINHSLELIPETKKLVQTLGIFD
jgi:hypothetical protein